MSLDFGDDDAALKSLLRLSRNNERKRLESVITGEYDNALITNVQWTDIKSERNVQGTDSCGQDGDHTGGHYISLFAEQLTRTLKVHVFTNPHIVAECPAAVDQLLLGQADQLAGVSLPLALQSEVSIQVT